MGWLGLDPESIAARVRASGAPQKTPTLAGSVIRGVAGFTILSVAGFCPWALGGSALRHAVGEAGLYIACALVFIGLSGPLLHRLILGPGSLGRFTALFGAAFSVYAAAWIAGWMTLHGHTGSLVGLFTGTAAMGSLLAFAFGERGALLKSVAALFILNTAGYYAGGWVEGWVAGLKNLSFAGLAVEKPAPITVAMLLWGVFYGIGFGAGLGLAFHFCQETARRRIAS